MRSLTFIDDLISVEEDSAFGPSICREFYPWKARPPLQFEVDI